MILVKEGLGNFPKIEKSLTGFRLESLQKNEFVTTDSILATRIQ